MINFEYKEKYGFYDLVNIIKILRGEGGCPWDIEQTHESIRRNFIEETYEAIEAIDTKNTELLREELGDVMLQVVFHAGIENDAGNFDIDDVCDKECRKMIFRHPHIFGNVKADTSEEVLKNWDEIKKREKGQKTQAETLDSISKSMPALMRADKVVSKALKMGYSREFDLSDLSTEKGIGEALLAIVAAARKIKADPEQLLYNATESYIEEFKAQEK